MGRGSTSAATSRSERPHGSLKVSSNWTRSALAGRSHGPSAGDLRPASLAGMRGRSGPLRRPRTRWRRACRASANPAEVSAARGRIATSCVGAGFQPSLTASYVRRIGGLPAGRVAAGTSVERPDDRDREPPTRCCDRVGDVALGSDRRRLWVDNLGEGQFFRASQRRRLLRGELSPARRSGDP